MLKVLTMIMMGTIVGSCSGLKRDNDLNPVSDLEFNEIINKDNKKIELMYNSLIKMGVSSCIYEKYEFGTTEVCSSYERNVIYVKRNNVIIFQTHIVKPDPSITVDSSKRNDLSI